MIAFLKISPASCFRFRTCIDKISFGSVCSSSEILQCDSEEAIRRCWWLENSNEITQKWNVSQSVRLPSLIACQKRTLTSHFVFNHLSICHVWTEESDEWPSNCAVLWSFSRSFVRSRSKVTRWPPCPLFLRFHRQAQSFRLPCEFFDKGWDALQGRAGVAKSWTFSVELAHSVVDVHFCCWWHSIFSHHIFCLYELRWLTTLRTDGAFKTHLLVLFLDAENFCGVKIRKRIVFWFRHTRFTSLNRLRRQKFWRWGMHHSPPSKNKPPKAKDGKIQHQNSFSEHSIFQFGWGALNTWPQ